MRLNLLERLNKSTCVSLNIPRVAETFCSTNRAYIILSTNFHCSYYFRIESASCLLLCWSWGNLKVNGTKRALLYPSTVVLIG